MRYELAEYARQGRTPSFLSHSLVSCAVGSPAIRVALG